MSAPPIPKVFHFVYGLRRQTEPFHLVHYLCLASCLSINRPDRVVLHCHHTPWGPWWDALRDRIQLQPVERPYFPRTYRYADRRIDRYRYAHESDFVRLDTLIDEGGVYADIDTLFVRPLPGRLFDHDFVLGREDDIVEAGTGRSRHSLCNAFIMSRPGARFGKLWRGQMEKAFDGTWSHHSTLLPWRLSQEHPDAVHVEPPASFYPFMWTREDLHRLFEEFHPIPAGAFSIHLWAHLWWAEGRRDFSDFHAGCLTPEYIRRVDTTFNVLARAHLPASIDPAPLTRRAQWTVREAAARAGDLADRILRRVRRGLAARRPEAPSP